MPKDRAAKLGQMPIPKLLIQQAVPAAIGILVMSLNILIDTVFVGQWIGANAIAAINVVLPVSFFIGALGMAIGIGGSSVISRALGNKNLDKALLTFGNQLTLTLIFTVSFVILGLYFIETLIPLFGGKGALYEPAKIYYTIVLYGVPVLGFCMMGNNVVRAEGKPRYAMYAMMLPSISNLSLDILFIYIFNWGMAGAAWATTISYGVCALYLVYFFRSKNSELQISFKHFILDLGIVRQIGALGSVTLARQAVVSVVVLLVNSILYDFGGETTVAVYAIISRTLMFALFPVLGITQGFLPIAGYNYGAQDYQRVREVIKTALLYATTMACIISMLIFIFTESFVSIFTDDAAVLNQTPNALRWVFAATPIIGIQLIGAAYFQAIGKALPALLLTLTRQGFFLIPLIFILPPYFGVFGVWIAFPIGEFIATLITGFYLLKEIKTQLDTSSH